MPQDTKDPKTPRNAATGNHRRPPGGKRRSEAEIEAILTEVESLLDFGVGRAQLLRTFAHLPPRTLDDYIRLANDRIQDENAEQRKARRARALRRNYGYLRQMVQDREAFLKGDGTRGIAADPARVPAMDHAINRVESHIARLEGTFAPEQVEIIKRQGWEDLSDTELESVRKTGRLPNGVTAEDLAKRN